MPFQQNKTTFGRTDKKKKKVKTDTTLVNLAIDIAKIFSYMVCVGTQMIKYFISLHPLPTSFFFFFQFEQASQFLIIFISLEDVDSL